MYRGDTASSLATDAVAELTFEGGALTGSTGCNGIQGGYRIDGTTLHLDDFVTTDAACDPEVMVLEDAVLALSGASVDYEIVAGRLTLALPDGRGLGLHDAER
jgi:heat shock protein HslJ